MTKICLLADTHWGVRADNRGIIENMKRFLDTCFFPEIDKQQIKTIVHLGDVVDRPKFVNYSTLSRMTEDFVNPILDRGIDLHVIVGNHDTYYKDTNELNAVTELYGHLPIKIYTRPTDVQIGDTNILMMPWICQDTHDESMDKLRTSNSQILFGHLQVTGFEMYRGSYCTEGYDKELFDRFDVVASGHFHHRSSFNNIYYLGTPCQFIWSDFDGSRGFHIFDTETRHLEFYENKRPMFRKVFYNDDGRSFEEVVDHDFEECSDCYVKVIIIAKTNPFWFDMFIEKLEKSGPSHVQVVEDHFLMDSLDEEEINLEAEDTLSIFKTQINKIKDKTVNKDTLSQMVTQLYIEAQVEDI